MLIERKVLALLHKSSVVYAHENQLDTGLPQFFCQKA